MLAYTSTSTPWPQRHPPSRSQGVGAAWPRHVAPRSRRRGSVAAADGADEASEAAELVSARPPPRSLRGRRRGAVAAAEGADEAAAEAAELVRALLRRTGGGKERLVAV